MGKGHAWQRSTFSECFSVFCFYFRLSKCRIFLPSTPHTKQIGGSSYCGLHIFFKKEKGFHLFCKKSHQHQSFFYNLALKGEKQNRIILRCSQSCAVVPSGLQKQRESFLTLTVTTGGTGIERLAHIFNPTL